MPVGLDDEPGDPALLAQVEVARVDVRDRVEHDLPALEEERVENLLLGVEVVVDEPVGDTCLVRDVRHAAVMEAAPREHADTRVEDQPALADTAVRLGSGGH